MPRRRLVATLAVVLGGWIVAAIWIVPWVIREAYAGESLAVLNALIEGRHHPVERYLGLWSGLALRTSLVLGVLSMLALIWMPVSRRLRAVRQREAGVAVASTARWTLLLVAWVAILAGLLEATIATVRHRIQHVPSGEIVSGEVVWMAPAAAASVLLLAALVLLAADRTRRTRGTLPRAIPGICIALASFSAVQAARTGVAWYAAAILAAGVGAAASRGLLMYPVSVPRLVRRSLPWMAGGMLVWGMTLPLWRRAKESRVVEALPAARPEAPNVLVIIWDAVRASNLSVYGYERPTTPELERLAARGAVFERAFATAPWTLPSHASLFTGRYPHELSAGRRTPLDGTHPTIAEAMARRGYATGGFIANLFYGSPDYGIGRGFAWYDARPPLRVPVVLDTYWLTRAAYERIAQQLGNHERMLGRRASHVRRSLLDWIDRHPDRPFFAVINQFDAHEPYRPPAPFPTIFTATAPRYWFTDLEESYPPELLRELRDAYDTSIRYLDHELAQLLADLRERRLLDNTIVIVTADHGEEFGEHGSELFGHARSVFVDALRVPLIVYAPGRVPAGVRRMETVSIRDIPATVMEAVAVAEPHPFPGTSLLRYANGTISAAEAAEPRLSSAERHPWAIPESRWPIAHSDIFSLVSERFHYIVTKKGEELYDLDADPGEQRDIAARSEHAPTIVRFRASLDSIFDAAGGPRRARASMDWRPAESVVSPMDRTP